jgi:hypothetical protein
MLSESHDDLLDLSDDENFDIDESAQLDDLLQDIDSLLE